MSEQKPVPNLMKALRESLEKAVQPPATQQESARVDVVAREIAKELMSNGFGDQGDRLAIRLGGQDFGGWSLDGAARQIRITLEREGYVLDRMAEATRRAQLKVSTPPAVWQPIETAPKDGRRAEGLGSRWKCALSTPAPVSPVEPAPPTLECCACGHLNTPQQATRLEGEWRSSGEYVCLDSDACARRIAECSEPPVEPTPEPETCTSECNPYMSRCGAKFCTFEDMAAHEQECKRLVPSEETPR